MSSWLIAVIALGCLLVGLGSGYWLPPHGRPVRRRERPVKRILLPFAGQAISLRALQAAVRLAKAENALLMPTYLARVPRRLPIDAALPSQSAQAMPLLEAIEQHAAQDGIPVDARVSRGRTYQDALRRLLAEETFDRIIVSATDNSRTGLTTDDLRWLLEHVPAEVLILRPAPEDTRRVSATALHGHF